MIITEHEKEFLLNEMHKLLDEYGYDYEDDALIDIIAEWELQKEPLIEAFKKHPNYIEGKFLIAFATNYEREIDKNAIRGFRNWLVNVLTLIAIPEDLKTQPLTAYNIPSDIEAYIRNLDIYARERTLSQEHANRLNEILPQIHPHAGEKTSRAINRFCSYLGFNKLEYYNHEYAKFADALSPLTIKRHTVLSLNPLDYLTMSFGNSWASCHTIDKNNQRHMPNSYQGQYSSGTISYMLDPTSMVFYTVDASYDGTDYWTQPKIQRQMFHWGEDKLIQGRLYPQSNDGDDVVYAPYRQIVQGIMAQIWDFPNLWTFSRGCEAASKYVNSYGTHYRDYQSFGSCTLSKIKDRENDNHIEIGADPICIECGQRHNVTSNINHCTEIYYCARCGAMIEDEEDVYWVGDETYCGECTAYCEDCDEYSVIDDMTYVDSVGRYVCSYCLSEYYGRCDDCGKYYPRDDMNYIESADRDVCDDCLRNNYGECEICGELVEASSMEINDDDDYCCPSCYEAWLEAKQEEEEEESND